MKRTLAILAFCLVSLSCATASAYTGPVSDKPTVSVSYMRHVMHTDDIWQHGYVETIATAAITNPSLHEMTAILDCSVSRTTITIPPRTTSYVLLDPADKECVIR